MTFPTRLRRESDILACVRKEMDLIRDRMEKLEELHATERPDKLQERLLTCRTMDYAACRLSETLNELVLLFERKATEAVAKLEELEDIRANGGAR